MPTPRTRTHRRAFSLIEAALATVIVGGLMLAVLEGVGASVKAGRVASDRQRAALLAATLLDECARLPFDEPSVAPTPPPGLDDGEQRHKRETLDDVDDFDGLDESPTDPGGTALEGVQTWTWRCEVVNVDSTGKTADDTGLKRITVTVLDAAGRTLARAARIRSRARDEASIKTAQNQSTPAYFDTQTVEGLK